MLADPSCSATDSITGVNAPLSARLLAPHLQASPTHANSVSSATKPTISAVDINLTSQEASKLNKASAFLGGTLQVGYASVKLVRSAKELQA